MTDDRQISALFLPLAFPSSRSSFLSLFLPLAPPSPRSSFPSLFLPLARARPLPPRPPSRPGQRLTGGRRAGAPGAAGAGQGAGPAPRPLPPRPPARGAPQLLINFTGPRSYGSLFAPRPLPPRPPARGAPTAAPPGPGAGRAPVEDPQGAESSAEFSTRRFHRDVGAQSESSPPTRMERKKARRNKTASDGRSRAPGRPAANRTRTGGCGADETRPRAEV